MAVANQSYYSSLRTCCVADGSSASRNLCGRTSSSKRQVATAILHRLPNHTYDTPFYEGYSFAFAGIENNTLRDGTADFSISISSAGPGNGSSICPPFAADRQQAIMISKPSQALAKLQG